jgi:gamma-glutamyl-gamma-aminobutyrate hydrolase PuuD
MNKNKLVHQFAGNLVTMDLVQWHPEIMLRKNNDMLCFFKSFIKLCHC